MFKRADMTWMAKQLIQTVNKKKVTFDNVVQRGYVWDNKRKSLLIHSMITGYPIPPLYAVKNENSLDVYDMIDGQQRSLAMTEFFNGGFALENIPEVEVENEDGTIDLVDINTLHFDEMEPALQDKILSCPITIYYFEGLTDDEVAEMFFRLNNGKPLSAIELTRVRAKSMKTINELGKHELFKNALTEKALSRYTNEDIVIKAYAMLHEDNPSLETKVIRPLMETVEFTEDDVRQLNEVFDRILAVYPLIEDKKIARRLLTRTHLISVVPWVWKSLQDGLSDKQFAEWFAEFFNGKRATTISSLYNACCRSGSNKADSVSKRNEELRKSFEYHFGKSESPEKPEAKTA